MAGKKGSKSKEASTSHDVERREIDLPNNGRRGVVVSKNVDTGKLSAALNNLARNGVTFEDAGFMDGSHTEIKFKDKNGLDKILCSYDTGDQTLNAIVLQIYEELKLPPPKLTTQAPRVRNTAETSSFGTSDSGEPRPNVLQDFIDRGWKVPKQLKDYTDEDLGWIVTIDPNKILQKGGRRLADLSGDLSKHLEQFGTVVHDPIAMLNADQKDQVLKGNAKIPPAIMQLSHAEFKKFNEKFSDVLIKEPIRDRVIKFLNVTSQSATDSVSDSTSDSASATTPTYLWNIDWNDHSPRNGVLDAPPADGTGVDVYVIDCGVLPLTLEFGDRVKPVVSLVTTEPTDYVGDNHGTHVASVAGGNTYGIAKGINIYPIKIMDKTGNGLLSWAYGGISKATAQHQINVANNSNNKPVSNMSWTISAAVGIENFQKVMQAASDADFIQVVAAGNYQTNGCNYLPAGINIDPNNVIRNVIVAGGLSPDGSMLAISNFGLCVTAYQPGDGIVAAIGQANGKLVAESQSGTSEAAPSVTGIAAIQRSLLGLTQPAAAVTDALYANSMPIKPTQVDIDCAGDVPPGPGARTLRIFPQTPLENMVTNPGATSLVAPPQLIFTPLVAASDFAAFTFTLDTNLPQDTDLQLVVLSGDVPVGLADYYNTPSTCENQDFRAGIQTLPITTSGRYWVKYYQVDGDHRLDVGTGAEIDSNIIQTYANLGSGDGYSYFTGGDPITQFGFSLYGGQTSVQLSNFVGSGALTSANTGTNAPSNSITLAPVQPPAPTNKPTDAITGAPTHGPSKRPTTLPSKKPTHGPSKRPTPKPIASTTGPTRAITGVPTTITPTNKPAYPTSEPTIPATGKPTHAPSGGPTHKPTARPTTTNPSARPTTHTPSNKPSTESPTSTGKPTYKPSKDPTTVKPTTTTPSNKPTYAPSGKPTTAIPSKEPTPKVTHSPITTKEPSTKNPTTKKPTIKPTTTTSPTSQSPTYAQLTPSSELTYTPTNAPIGANNTLRNGEGNMTAEYAALGGAAGAGAVLLLLAAIRYFARKNHPTKTTLTTTPNVSPEVEVEADVEKQLPQAQPLTFFHFDEAPSRAATLNNKNPDPTKKSKR